MENQTTTETMSAKMMKKRSPVKTIIAVIVLVLIVGGAIYYSRSMTPEKKQALENEQLMQSVGKLILVPNEQPIIATINQADVLVKEQAFYAGAENGDKLVIFPKTQKAIIYSPKRNIIINSGPFVINGGTTTNPTGTGTTTNQ